MSSAAGTASPNTQIFEFYSNVLKRCVLHTILARNIQMPNYTSLRILCDLCKFHALAPVENMSENGEVDVNNLLSDFIDLPKFLNLW